MLGQQLCTPNTKQTQELLVTQKPQRARAAKAGCPAVNVWRGCLWSVMLCFLEPES